MEIGCNRLGSADCVGVVDQVVVSGSGGSTRTPPGRSGQGCRGGDEFVGVRGAGCVVSGHAVADSIRRRPAKKAQRFPPYTPPDFTAPRTEHEEVREHKRDPNA